MHRHSVAEGGHLLRKLLARFGAQPVQPERQRLARSGVQPRDLVRCQLARLCDWRQARRMQDLVRIGVADLRGSVSARFKRVVLEECAKSNAARF
jgi:hypothetical protein